MERTLKLIHSVSPFAAGVTDGLHHQTIGQANLLGSGAERTAEGLHLLGAENWATVDLIQTTFTKLLIPILTSWTIP